MRGGGEGGCRGGLQGGALAGAALATHPARASAPPDSHAADPHVALKHMACKVSAPDEEGGLEQVTFLYRLDPGACPKSYGANVARLAGIPVPVVRLSQVWVGGWRVGAGRQHA